MHKLLLTRFLVLITLGGFVTLSAFAAPLEEIIVTAQKRSENVQDVPITISAFTASELSKAGVNSYNDIGMVTPGLETSRQIGAAVPFLRGVGSQSGTVGVESATTMFVDDIYLSSTVDAALNFNNIERIEVLKGPQGTLFGRNTTGGLIHIVTKEPSHEPELNLGVYAGNYQTYGATLYAANALSDTIAADFSASVQRMSDFYGTNIANGDGVGFEEHTSARTKIVWEPSDRTKVRFIAAISEKDEDIGISRQCDKNATLGCLGGQLATADFQDINSDVTPTINSESWSASIKVNHSFESFDFVSISAYNYNENYQLLDQDSTALPIVTAPLNQTNKTFSQEFQILSNADDKPYSWIVGLYYWNDDSRYDPLQLFGAGIGAVVNINIFSGVDTESLAVFAQGTYELSDRTDLTLGLRYTRDERENSGFTEFGPDGSPFLVATYSDDETWSEPTWRIALNHDFTDNIMGYITHNRGFKSGTFNTVNSSGVVFDPVEPEILDAYEIGVKGDFIDGRLRLNASAFFYDYENIQLQQIEGGIAFLLNAAEAEISGFEIEGQFAVTDNLTTRFGLSVLDTEYTDFTGCPINVPVAGGNSRTEGNCTGNNLIRAPEYTYNVGFVYSLPTDVGTFDLSSTLSYSDGFYWEPGNRNFEESYTLLSAEISWTDSSERYKVRLYGKNLLDEEYSIYTTEATFGDTEAAAAPLTFGIAFEMKM